jgi:hypothetical protein
MRTWSTALHAGICGRNPTLINAYGAYGIILDMGFSATTLAFLEAGGVLVYAHVRGGGERGDALVLIDETVQSEERAPCVLVDTEYIVATINMRIEFDRAKDAANRARHDVSLAIAEELDWDSALVWVDTRFG